MKNWKIISIITIIAGAALVTTSAYAIVNGQIFPGMHGTNPSNTYGYYGGMMGGRGMMGGYGYYPPTTSPTQSNTQAPYSTGPGCGNHGLWGPNYATNGTTVNPIGINTALTNAQNYVNGLSNPELAVKQVEEYTNNYYVLVTEKSTGNGAFELLINKYSGIVVPEMGPNMMWNTKYGTLNTGMMGGMMGSGGMMSGYAYGYNVIPTTTTPVNETQAKANAQQYLTTNYPGTTTGDTTTFYGYYTIEVVNSETTFGMLSVNGYTGQVWFHTWHGTFVQELNVT